LKLLKNG